MTREEFFEWLNTCPTYAWYNEGEYEGYIRILFETDQEEEQEPC